MIFDCVKDFEFQDSMLWLFRCLRSHPAGMQTSGKRPMLFFVGKSKVKSELNRRIGLCIDCTDFLHKTP